MRGSLRQGSGFVRTDLSAAVLIGVCMVVMVSGWSRTWVFRQHVSVGEGSDSVPWDNGEALPGDLPSVSIDAAGRRTFVNSIGMTFVLIPPGAFVMGSPRSEEGRDADEGPRRVRVGQPFYLGACEVTVGQFRRFVEETGHRTCQEESPMDGLAFAPSAVPPPLRGKVDFFWHSPGFPQDDQHPVVYVAWQDATEFCRWLRQKEGHPYRLPTEVEWEYACRAGTTTRWSSGNREGELLEAAQVASILPTGQGGFLPQEPATRFTRAVGSFPPNAFGLYDMHGNVWEWCDDQYREDYGPASQAGDRAESSLDAFTRGNRVIRGGSFMFAPWRARSANRYSQQPWRGQGDVGFRLALSAGDCTRH